jgi:hypothetical protein
MTLVYSTHAGPPGRGVSCVGLDGSINIAFPAMAAAFR